MTTKTIAKKTKPVAKPNAKATKATTTKATKKSATVANTTAKESKPASKKLSQIEAAIQILGKSKDPMNCKALVEAMHGAGSPQAQRIVMLGLAQIEDKIKLADQVIHGTDNVVGLNLPGAPTVKLAAE